MVEKKIDKKENFTKYEIARIIGSRALQIAMGAPFLVKLSDKDLAEIKYNPIEIAKIELKKDVLPLAIKRPMPIIKEEKKAESIHD